MELPEFSKQLLGINFLFPHFVEESNSSNKLYQIRIELRVKLLKLVAIFYEVFLVVFRWFLTIFIWWRRVTLAPITTFLNLLQFFGCSFLCPSTPLEIQFNMILNSHVLFLQSWELWFVIIVVLWLLRIFVRNRICECPLDPREHLVSGVLFLLDSSLGECIPPCASFSKLHALVVLDFYFAVYKIKEMLGLNLHGSQLLALAFLGLWVGCVF